MTGQRFSSRTLQKWDAVATLGPAPVYDVVRGLAASLPIGGVSDQCRASSLSTADLSVSEDPSAGGAFWYVVRARNACSTGTWGTTSEGNPRNSSVCP